MQEPEPGLDVCRKVFGAAYGNVRLRDFRLSENPDEAARQRRVLTGLRMVTGFQTNESKPTIPDGKNFVFVGPPGTGKDMLMAWLGRVAIGSGLSVFWSCGADLHSRTRDLARSDGNEAEFSSRMRSFDVLAISDPTPPGAELTPAQASWLYRLFDDRARSGRPVWITINAADQTEASRMLGAQVWDRAVDGAIVFVMQWESFRRPSQVFA